MGKKYPAYRLLLGVNLLLNFSGLRAIFFKTFTVALFLGILFLLFYHLGTSCFWVLLVLNPIVTRVPDGFSTSI
jgi:hypothetical protein